MVSCPRRPRPRASSPLRTGRWCRARDGRGREHGQAVAIALRIAVLDEKATTTKALHHPVARALQHRRHIARRQVPNGTEVELVALVSIGTVEKHRVHVWVQLQIGRCALNRDHRSALAAWRSTSPLAVEAEHGLHEDPRQCRQQPAVVPKALSPRKRHREHPLPEVHGWQHVLDEMCRGGAHLPTEARRAEATALAAKRLHLGVDAIQAEDVEMNAHNAACFGEVHARHRVCLYPRCRQPHAFRPAQVGAKDVGARGRETRELVRKRHYVLLYRRRGQGAVDQV